MKNSNKFMPFRPLRGLLVLWLGLLAGGLHAQAASDDAPDPTPTTLKALVFQGNSSIGSDKLLRVLEPYMGQAFNKDMLESLRQAVYRAYQIDGYALVDVRLPSQDLTKGLLQVEIHEIHLAHAVIDNQSPADLSDFAKSLDSRRGEVVHSRQLERMIAVMKERPGVQEVHPVLQSAKEVEDAVDLSITAKGSPMHRLGLGLDNYGSPISGRNRMVLDFDVSPLPGLAGLLQGSWAAAPRALQSSSEAGHTRTGYLRYEQPLGVDGWKMLAYHNRSVYSLSDALGGSSNQGFAKTYGLGLGYPLILETRKRMNLNLAIEDSVLLDKQFLWDVKKNTRSFKLNADGFFLHNTFKSAAQLNYSFDIKFGNLKYQDPSLAGFAPTGALGDYVKLTSFIQNSVALTNRDMILMRWSNQLTNKNLDASERMGLTGPTAVRGFTSNVQSVDVGNLLSLEYRHRFQDSGFTGSVFYDHGQGQISKHPSASAGVNSVRLSAMGLGLAWSLDKWFLQAQWVSRQQASTLLTATQPTSQFWLTARVDMRH